MIWLSCEAVFGVNLKIIAAALIAFLLSGCNAIFYPYSEVSGDTIGKCFAFSQGFELYGWDSRSPFMGDYVTFPESGSLSYGMEQSVEKGSMVRIAVLPQGQRVVVEKIAMHEPILMKTYVRVLVRIESGEHQGKVVDLPAHVPYHPRPPVLASMDDDPSAVSFLSDYLQYCDQE